MDSFRGSDPIFLQPMDAEVPYQFKFVACSAATANDGSIPYGSTVNKKKHFRIHHANSTAESTALISSVSLSSNTFTAYLTYSTNVVGRGEYHLTATIVCALGGNSTAIRKEFDLNRLFMGNR